MIGRNPEDAEVNNAAVANESSSEDDNPMGT